LVTRIDGDDTARRCCLRVKVRKKAGKGAASVVQAALRSRGIGGPFAVSRFPAFAAVCDLRASHASAPIRTAGERRGPWTTRLRASWPHGDSMALNSPRLASGRVL